MNPFKSLNTVNKLVSLSLSLVLLGQGLGLSVFGLSSVAGAADVLTGDVHVTVTPANLLATLPIAATSKKISMSLRDVDIRDALRAVARKGGFNVLIDESVTGTITLDLNDVRIYDALELLKTYGGLAYAVQNNSLAVATATSAKGQTYLRSVTRIIPLHHANAKTVADLLNRTVFGNRNSSSSSGGSGGGAGGNSGPVTPDFQTNSLIVVGTPNDIKMVAEHVEALDQPREMKTWRLSQANALDVATILSSSVFNEGQVSLAAGGSGGGGSGTGSSPSSMRVVAENIQDSTGTAAATQASGGGSGGNQALTGDVTLRAKVKVQQTVSINPAGPIIIPDTRLNTITLLGTAEQIATAESLIPMLDRKIPQVTLEVALVELSDTATKELGFSSASQGPYSSSGTNTNYGGNSLINAPFSNVIGRPTSNQTPLESIWRLTSNPIRKQFEMTYQLNALLRNNRAKLLANPTVVTTSDSETLISIADEILQSVTITQAQGTPPTATDNIGEAGIFLNILPRVGADGTVSMRVRPVVSTIAGTRRDANNNLVTLLSKRELLAQDVAMHDGETFVLGGLVQNTNTQNVTENPMLSKLPIVGALARNSTLNKKKTELVLMITPHILNDSPAVARNSNVPGSRIAPGNPGSPSSDGFVPVSLTESNPSKALPPLEKVHVIGNTSSGFVPASGPVVSDSNLVRPAPLRSDELLANPPASRARPAPKPKDTSESDISNDSIQSIMNKFK